MNKLNDTLLISRINPQDYSNTKKKIFFLIGKLNIPNEEKLISSVLKNVNTLEETDIVYKYNGVELNIEIKQIPKIISVLCKNNIDVFSIFETYNPGL